MCVISMVQGERRSLADSNSEQRTYLDDKLPSQRPNASALLQRDVQPRLPSGLESVCLLSLWCTPCKLLSLRRLLCKVSFCSGLHPMPSGAWLWLSLLLAVR